jgi:putative transposase
MIYRQVHELAAGGFPVAVICRCLGVSRSGYYGWRSRRPSARRVADEKLMDTITEVHAMSRYSYGAPRVHAELQPGLRRAMRTQTCRAFDASGGHRRDLSSTQASRSSPGAGTP